MQEVRKREIRIAADAFREKCKVSRYGIIDLFKDCERLGYKLLRYPLGDEADLGLVIKKDNDIVIFTNSCSRLSREIFTLAHEIGHAILHLNNEISFVDDNNTISNRNADEKEQEANYFAACLLMPSDEVERFADLQLSGFNENGLTALDIARIMSEFNVSFDMVLNRLENLGKINASTRVNLDIERIEKRVGNLLRSVGGNSKLNMSDKVIDIPYEYIDYTIYNYNQKAIPRDTLERVLAYYQLSMEDISDKLEEHPEEDEDIDDMIRRI